MQLFPTEPSTKPAATYESTQKSGFSENWNAALGSQILHRSPVLSPLIPTMVESQRNNKLMGYRESGEINNAIWNFYGGDMDGLAVYARENLGILDIPTYGDFEKAKEEEYGSQRAYTAGVQSNQSFMGKVGMFGGVVHGAAVDPLYAASFLTGYGTAATIGQAALRVGLIEAGIETLAQPSIMSHHETMNVDYNASDALTSIAFAGLGGAALAGLTKGAELGLKKLFTPKDLTVADGLKVFEKMEKEDPELDLVVNTLRNANPTDNLYSVLKADEGIDAAFNNVKAKRLDPRFDEGLDAPAIDIALEEKFYARTAEPTIPTAPPKVSDEGVPHVTPSAKVAKTGEGLEGFTEVVKTPKKDLNPYDAKIYELDQDLLTIKECY